MDLTVGLPFRRLVPLGAAAVGTAGRRPRIRCVSAEQVALIPAASSAGSSAYLTDDGPELAFYCSECAEREFRD